MERHFPDGLKEIRFSDGALKVILPGGEVQSLGNIDEAMLDPFHGHIGQPADLDAAASRQPIAV